MGNCTTCMCETCNCGDNCDCPVRDAPSCGAEARSTSRCSPDARTEEMKSPRRHKLYDWNCPASTTTTILYYISINTIMLERSQDVFGNYATEERGKELGLRL